MPSFRVFPAALAGTVLLAGCIVKSPPTTAEIQQQALGTDTKPLPAAWKAGGASGHVADNWLASFGDPQLDALVAEAITHNPDLRVSATRVEQANQYVELAKSALRPSVNVLGTGGAKMGGGDVSSALQGISLGASWEPDLWGRLRYGRNAAQEQEASVKADFEFARQSIAAAVARGWFTASETWLQLQISEGMVTSMQDLVTLAEKRRSVGVGVEQDVSLARANVENARDNAQQIRLAHGQSVRALELLLGRYPAAELAVRHELGALPPPVPAGFPLEMLERRPDMIAAERRVAAAFNRVGEAKAAQLPRIVLNANVAAISSEILQLQKDYENPSAGAGARLIAPLYTGGALQTQVAIRTIEQKESIADYARLALRALGDVENILAASAALDERQHMLEQALVDQQHALELIQSSERVGRTDQRSIRQQQLSRDAALLTLLRVQSEQLSQRVNLHLALVGASSSRRSRLAPKPQTNPAPGTAGRMIPMKSSSPAKKSPGQIQTARARLAKATAQLAALKKLAKLAKQKRKAAKQAARLARDKVREAKAEVANAKAALATTASANAKKNRTAPKSPPKSIVRRAAPSKAKPRIAAAPEISIDPPDVALPEVSAADLVPPPAAPKEPPADDSTPFPLLPDGNPAH